MTGTPTALGLTASGAPVNQANAYQKRFVLFTSGVLQGLSFKVASSSTSGSVLTLTFASGVFGSVLPSANDTFVFVGDGA